MQIEGEMLGEIWFVVHEKREKCRDEKREIPYKACMVSSTLCTTQCTSRTSSICKAEQLERCTLVAGESWKRTPDHASNYFDRHRWHQITALKWSDPSLIFFYDSPIRPIKPLVAEVNANWQPARTPISAVLVIYGKIQACSKFWISLSLSRFL